jgi:hypothetical protein
MLRVVGWAHIEVEAGKVAGTCGDDGSDSTCSPCGLIGSTMFTRKYKDGVASEAFNI